MRSVLAVLAVVALSGCFEYGSSSVFGPAGSAAAELPEWAFSVRAKPAQGPTPLRVTFTLDIRDGPVDLPWRADFGDGSPAAAGRGPKATLEHVYIAQGLHAVYVTIGEGSSAARSTLAVTVLPPGAPPHPDEVAEATPLPREPPATQRAEGPGGPAPAPSSESATGSTTSPSSSSSTGPTSTPSSSSNSSTRSNSTTANPSSSSSSASTASSNTSTSPATSNSSSESPSSSSTESPSPSPSPTNSSSSSSSSSASDPPSPTLTETSSSSSPDTSTSATETTSPPPTNMTLDANLTADPAMATAPATVTFTVNVTDPGGDAAWNLTLDGVEVGLGTEADSPWSFNQTYDAEGNHTAVLTAWDGIETVRREVWVMVAAAQEPAA